MTAGVDEPDFVLTVVDVFTIRGRGTVVTGSIEAGVLRAGEEVEVWANDRLVARARATPEIICRRTTDLQDVGLSLRGLDAGLLSPGQTIRRAARES